MLEYWSSEESVRLKDLSLILFKRALKIVPVFYIMSPLRKVKKKKMPLKH